MNTESTDTCYLVKMVKTLNGPERQKILKSIRRLSIQQVRLINFKKLMDPQHYNTTQIRKQLSDSHQLEL